MARLLRISSWAAAALFMCAWARAGSVTVSVEDDKGEPVEDAVVYVQAMPGRSFKPPAKAYVMDQVDLEFVPHVLPILVGSRVEFPNKDDVHHSLYSFSPAKKFELPLYKGKPAKPVKFEKPGVVKLGCNIHDWMSGIILVVENPYFAVTGRDGTATLKDLPDDVVVPLLVYTERLRDPVESTRKDTLVDPRTPATVRWQLELKRRPEKKPHQAGEY